MDGMLASCARRPQEGSGAHMQWISMALQVVGRCMWWWYMPWCNQWLASFCRLCRPRTIARSTSLSACSARVVRGRHLRLSRASRGFRECSSASETDSGCNVAKVVAVGRSAAVFIRIVRSRQILSLFRLSGGATHRTRLSKATILRGSSFHT